DRVRSLEIIETRIGVQSHMRQYCPRRLQLPSVRDVLKDSLVCGRGPRYFGKRQFEADQGDALQNPRLQRECERLRSAFRVQVLVPGEFGVVPRIAEFPPG